MLRHLTILRRNAAVRWAGLIITCLCLITACETGNPFAKSSTPPPAELLESDTAPPTNNYAAPPPEPGLPLSASQRFSDVPLPEGVKEDYEKTFVYEDKNLQIGRMVYTTKSSVNDLAQFYIRECPAADWKLQNVIQADGADLLFLKAGKRLMVNVQDLGITRGRQLTVTVTPEGSL